MGGSFVPSSTTNFGQGKLDSPDFSLVAETIFADSFELSIAGRLLEGAQT